MLHLALQRFAGTHLDESNLILLDKAKEIYGSHWPRIRRLPSPHVKLRDTGQGETAPQLLYRFATNPFTCPTRANGAFHRTILTDGSSAAKLGQFANIKAVYCDPKDDGQHRQQCSTCMSPAGAVVGT